MGFDVHQDIGTKLFSDILQSPEIGLQPTKHDPCIFHGTLIPGKPPLYLAIYVDDFLYFSLDDLGMKFDWNHSSHDSFSLWSSC